MLSVEVLQCADMLVPWGDSGQACVMAFVYRDPRTGELVTVEQAVRVGGGPSVAVDGAAGAVASVWEVPAGSVALIQKIKAGTVTLAELAGGAVQRGAPSDDYGLIGRSCPPGHLT